MTNEKDYADTIVASGLVSESARRQVEKQKAAFAERINPRTFNFSPKLTAIVGAIIGHDYGVTDRKGGRLYSLSITSDGYVMAGSTASDGGGAFIGSADDLDRNLADYRTLLTEQDRTDFDRIYATRVIDYRPARRRG